MKFEDLKKHFEVDDCFRTVGDFSKEKNNPFVKLIRENWVPVCNKAKINFLKSSKVRATGLGTYERIFLFNQIITAHEISTLFKIIEEIKPEYQKEMIEIIEKQILMNLEVFKNEAIKNLEGK